MPLPPPPPASELLQRARFRIGDPVHWRSGRYEISARYYRRSREEFVYDLIEIGTRTTPRRQRKVREVELELIIYPINVGAQ